MLLPMFCIQEKLKNHEKIEKDDLIPLILTPLMSGETTLKERIKTAFDITHQAASVTNVDMRKIDAMVYAMANKFLNKDDMEEIKEGIKLTTLGAILYNDGIKDGFEQGIEQGAKNKLQKLAANALHKGMSVEQIAELFGESVELISELTKDLR